MNKTFVVTIIIVFSFLSYATINQLSKDKKNMKRLPCQNETITFERINKNEYINDAIKDFENSDFIIKSNIEYSKYMKSNIKDNLSIKDLNTKFNKVLKKYIKDRKTHNNKLIIKYYLYENDKNDPKKKGSKSKTYAGYLKYKFIYDNKTIYQIQTDYMNIEGKNLENRISCVLNSFISLK